MLFIHIWTQDLGSHEILILLTELSLLDSHLPFKKLVFKRWNLLLDPPPPRPKNLCTVMATSSHFFSAQRHLLISVLNKYLLSVMGDCQMTILACILPFSEYNLWFYWTCQCSKLKTYVFPILSHSYMYLFGYGQWNTS